MLQHVPCDLCGEKHSELSYNIQKCNRQIVRCTGCGLLYVNPQNPQNLTYDFENKEERLEKYNKVRELAINRHDLCYDEVYAKEEESRILHFADRAEKVRKHCSAGGRLLDIGCARGLFLSNFSSSNEDFDIYGIEPREWICAKAINRLGDKVFCGTLREAALPDAHFDVVTMINLIEHLPTPKNTLLEVNRIMKPGGLLMIETPNVEGILTSIMGRRWHAFLEAEHNFFFSKTTIKDLLNKTGFKTVSIEPAHKLFTLRYLFYQTAWYNKTLSRFLTRLVETLGLSDRLIKLRQPGEMTVFARKSNSTKE